MPLGEALLERAAVAALGGLARDGVVVAVDDEQWVDADTGRLLEAAAVRLADVPVRWLVAVRSGHADRGLARVLEHELGERVARVDLAGLDDGGAVGADLGPVPGAVVAGGAAAGGGAGGGEPVRGGGAGPGDDGSRRA